MIIPQNFDVNHVMSLPCCSCIQQNAAENLKTGSLASTAKNRHSHFLGLQGSAVRSNKEAPVQPISTKQ